MALLEQLNDFNAVGQLRCGRDPTMAVKHYRHTYSRACFFSQELVARSPGDSSFPVISCHSGNASPSRITITICRGSTRHSTKKKLVLLITLNYNIPFFVILKVSAIAPQKDIKPCHTPISSLAPH